MSEILDLDEVQVFYQKQGYSEINIFESYYRSQNEGSLNRENFEKHLKSISSLKEKIPSDKELLSDKRIQIQHGHVNPNINKVVDYLEEQLENRNFGYLKPLLLAIFQIKEFSKALLSYDYEDQGLKKQQLQTATSRTISCVLLNQALKEVLKKNTFPNITEVELKKVLDGLSDISRCKDLKVVKQTAQTDPTLFITELLEALNEGFYFCQDEDRNLIQKIFFGEIESRISFKWNNYVESEKLGNERLGPINLDCTKDGFLQSISKHFRSNMENFSCSDGSFGTAEKIRWIKTLPKVFIFVVKLPDDQSIQKIAKEIMNNKELYLDNYLLENKQKEKDKENEILNIQKEIDRYGKYGITRQPIPRLLQDLANFVQEEIVRESNDMLINERKYNQNQLKDCLKSLKIYQKVSEKQIEKLKNTAAELESKEIKNKKYSLFDIVLYNGDAGTKGNHNFFFDSHKQKWIDLESSKLVSDSEIIQLIQSFQANYYYVLKPIDTYDINDQKSKKSENSNAWAWKYTLFYKSDDFEIKKDFQKQTSSEEPKENNIAKTKLKNEVNSQIEATNTEKYDQRDANEKDVRSKCLDSEKELSNLSVKQETSLYLTKMHDKENKSFAQSVFAEYVSTRQAMDIEKEKLIDYKMTNFNLSKVPKLPSFASYLLLDSKICPKIPNIIILNSVLENVGFYFNEFQKENKDACEKELVELMRSSEPGMKNLERLELVLEERNKLLVKDEQYNIFCCLFKILEQGFNLIENEGWIDALLAIGLLRKIIYKFSNQTVTTHFTSFTNDLFVVVCFKIIGLIDLYCLNEENDDKINELFEVLNYSLNPDSTIDVPEVYQSQMISILESIRCMSRKTVIEKNAKLRSFFSQHIDFLKQKSFSTITSKISQVVKTLQDNFPKTKDIKMDLLSTQKIEAPKSFHLGTSFAICQAKIQKWIKFVERVSEKQIHYNFVSIISNSENLSQMLVNQDLENIIDLILKC